jgi:hypothetical protein
MLYKINRGNFGIRQKNYDFSAFFAEFCGIDFWPEN